MQIIRKLEQANILCNAGSDTNFSMGREKCYYTIKEMTKLQGNNLLWLGECLGLEYVQYRTKDFVVPITGVYEEGQVGIGTGTVINANTILTCGHVIDEMKVDDLVVINKKENKIYDKKSHPKIDVGLVKLSEPVDLGYQIIFGCLFAC